MLDAALPRFTIEASDNARHNSSIFLSRPHEDPEPAYSLHRADPASSSSRNRYAAGLVDAFNPEVLFGEVLIQPKWTQPTLNQEEIRRNGGIPPPPEPTMPSDFTIQLYNPDQQIQVSQKSTAILGNVRWEFSLPQDVFRMPSSSDLDRSQHDPLAATTTPRVNFAWRKEGKFSKEMTCYMTGRSTDITQKKKSKEPDISIAHFKGLKDITVYEPNLYRMELEDQKGFEVVLLLAAAVIRDVFYARDLAAVFNVSDSSRKDSAGPTHSPAGTPDQQPATVNGAGAAAGGLYTSSPPPRPHSSSLPQPPRRSLNIQRPPQNQPQPQPPAADPRTQWEIEAETARLRQAASAEAKSAQRAEERARRERERAAEEETRRLRKMVEKEERDRARRERDEKAKVEAETERLRKLYAGGGPTGGVGGGGPVMSGTNGPYPQRPQTHSPNLQQAPYSAPLPPQQPPRPSASPYPQGQSQSQQWVPHQGYASHFGGSSSNLAPGGSSQQPPKKEGRLRRRSFLNIMGDGRDEDRMRKKSSVF